MGVVLPVPKISFINLATMQSQIPLSLYVYVYRVAYHGISLDLPSQFHLCVCVCVYVHVYRAVYHGIPLYLLSQSGVCRCVYRATVFPRLLRALD